MNRRRTETILIDAVTIGSANHIRSTPRKTASEVWAYFDKMSDSKFAKCRLCSKLYKTCGNTSNLLDHLKRAHPTRQKVCNPSNIVRTAPKGKEKREGMTLSELWAYLEDGDDKTTIKNDTTSPPSNDAESNDNKPKKGGRRKTSEVWNYFRKVKDGDYAECRFCSTIYKTCGNTSNIFDHLRRAHPAFRETPLPEESESQPAKRAGKSPSEVWQYFEKTGDGKFAQCCLCSKLCRTSGNTTNLLDHLKRSHPTTRNTDNVDSDHPTTRNTDNVDSDHIIEEVDSNSSDMWSFLEDAYRDVIEDNEDTDETDKVIKAEKDPLPQEEEEVWAIEEVKSENMSTTFEQLEEELQETAIAVDTIEFKDDMEFEVEIETETENQSTDVWSFYEQPQEDDDFVKCRLCSKYYKAIGGSTTNLLDHLKRAHPTCKVVSEANKKSKSGNGIRKRKNELKYKRKTISEVWSYFEKTENGEYAKCCFCSRHYKTSGNTSNMFDHLKRTHPEFRKKMVRSDKGTPEEFFKKAAENNWNLFQKRY